MPNQCHSNSSTVKTDSSYLRGKQFSWEAPSKILPFAEKTLLGRGSIQKAAALGRAAGLQGPWFPRQRPQCQGGQKNGKTCCLPR